MVKFVIISITKNYISRKHYVYYPWNLSSLAIHLFWSTIATLVIRRCLFKKAISYEEQEDEDYSILRRSLSRKDSIRKLLSTNQLRTESISMITIDEDLSPSNNPILITPSWIWHSLLYRGNSFYPARSQTPSRRFVLFPLDPVVQ